MRMDEILETMIANHRKVIRDNKGKVKKVTFKKNGAEISFTLLDKDYIQKTLF